MLGKLIQPMVDEILNRYKAVDRQPFPLPPSPSSDSVEATNPGVSDFRNPGVDGHGPNPS